MAEITPGMNDNLRKITNSGLMDGKKALTEAQGDVEDEEDFDCRKDAATALNKGGREAKEGVIAQYIKPGACAGILVEVNCETDFVAKNESFRAFTDNIAKTLVENPGADLEPLRVDAVSRMGENIKISRHQKLEV